VAAAWDAGIESHLIGETPAEFANLARAREFELCEVDREPPLTRTVGIGSYCVAGALDEVLGPARDAIYAADNLLLTSSIDASLGPTLRRLLVDIAQVRGGMRSKATIFVPLETEPGPTPAVLQAELERYGVEFREAVADRVCWKDSACEDGVRIVTAGRAEWFVKGTSHLPPLDALDAVAWVRFVASTTPYALRKLWVLEGARIGVAIVASRENRVDLRDEDFCKRARRLMVGLQGFGSAVLADEASEGVDKPEAHRRRADAWVANPQAVEQMVSRLRRARLAAFFAAVDYRLGEVARRLRERTGALPEEYESVFHDLHHVCRQFEQYYDQLIYGSDEAPVDEYEDQRALEAYAALLRGVVEPEVVAARVAELDMELAEHREVVA
jgi:hypothetical protein